VARYFSFPEVSQVWGEARVGLEWLKWRKVSLELSGTVILMIFGSLGWSTLHFEWMLENEL